MSQPDATVADEPVGPPVATLDVARDNITNFGGWIAHANTKAALVAAGLTFILGATAAQPKHIAVALAGATPAAAAARVALVLLGLTATLAFVAVGVALFPRTQPAPSRFGWPTVKDLPVDELRRATADELERDAWTHAQRLANIADRKYAALKVALWVGAVTLPAFVMWVALAARLAVK